MIATLSPLGVLVANVAGAAAIHAATGYAVHRLPVHRLAGDGWLWRSRAWERDGGWYRRVRIQRWKDRVPEAGALFAGGVSKRSVGRAGLPRFVVETRRAELGHWLAIGCTPLFALWNPPAGIALMGAYQLAVNLPCIAIQRYNRPRAERALAR
jgi:glycosyl-4,4'-diaponeurosporenoate acyltransferase